MGSRRCIVGALHVNVLICRGLREHAELGAADAVRAVSGVRPGFVRRLSGSCPSHEVLPLRRDPNPGARWNTTKTKWTRWCWRCSP